MGRIVALITLLVAAVLSACSDGGEEDVFQQTNLVADVAGRAAVTDPHLVNAWGIALSPTGPFWIADNGDGVTTLYDGSGTPFPAASPLVVTIAPPPGSPDDAGSPTGVVFNGTSDFVISNDAESGPAVFIYVTEDGTVSGWNRNVDPTNAIVAVDNSGAGSIYKGLALGSNSSGNFLFATDFKHARVDVFDSSFAAATLAGNFSDPDIPAGYAPFGIENLAGRLFVTYAKQDEDAEDDVRGPGNGFVDVYDTSGILVQRFAGGGALNAPWGMVIAPSSFGPLSGALLVGNFGDGRINAFDLSTGSPLGALNAAAETPIEIPGLWGLVVGNGANGGSASALYFTAGADDEAHGLFGSLRRAAATNDGGGGGNPSSAYSAADGGLLEVARIAASTAG